MLLRRLYHILIAAAALAALGAWLYLWPFNPAWAVLVGCVAGAILWRSEHSWLIIMPAAWPIIDFVPWTGRMYFAESDAFVCLIIAALSLRAALRPAPATGNSLRQRDVLCFVLLGSIALSYVISSARVLWPLPALNDNSFVGYDSPYNALRLSKGLLWALLLLPHWRRLARADLPRTIDWLSIGMTAGLVTVSLAALQERAAFSSLLDFTSNYRTTARFWEMNVGGAALDGWLMITLPFAAHRFMQTRRTTSLALYGAILALAAYAAFTTFSRGVYLGCGAMLLAGLPQYIRSIRERAAAPAPDRPAIATVAWTGEFLLVGAAVIGVVVFRSGGYRGLAAFYIACALVYAAGYLLRSVRGILWVLLALVVTPLVAFGFAMHDMISKLPYWEFAITSLVTGALVFHANRMKSDLGAAIAFVLLWTISGVTLICFHWSPENDLMGGLVGACALGITMLVQSFAPKPLWKPAFHHISALMIAGMIMCSFAVGAGSYFIGERFSTTEGDFQDRIQHWKDSLSLIENDAEWIFGIGTGRYSDRFFWRMPLETMPGTWHLGHDDADHYLELTGSHFGHLLYITQQIDTAASGPFVLHLRARAAAATAVRVEVCRKHLIYPIACLVAPDMQVPAGNVWTQISYVLKDSLPASSWYAPQQTSLSIGLNMNSQKTQITNLELIDASGRDLLGNGDFKNGIDRWFFTSDREHLPWHAKSIFVHLLVEQGWLGVSLFALCLVIAALRLLAMPAAHARKLAAPAILAALAGVVTVGMFDSLLDVPRDATFIYLLLGIALLLPRRPSPVRNHAPQATSQ